MAKFSWSEVFQSIEGEGPYSGWPTVYIRFTGCNFECRGFNNPENVDTTSIETLGFNPSEYKDIYSIPLITKGCDSIYSWDKKFKHMWIEGDETVLAQTVMDTIPHHQWHHPLSGTPVILSLTGGEPTLRAKHIPTLLEHPLFSELQYLLIETNCAVPLQDDFLKYLAGWVDRGTNRKLIWSNSPKLSGSGEQWEKAIKPEVAKSQLSYGMWLSNQVQQYFKFVCGPTALDFMEVAAVLQSYKDAGVIIQNNVYIMPVACLEEQQQNIAAKVADMCINNGYIYCHRIQNSVFGNGVGT